MPSSCLTCGASASEGKQIRAFAELGFGPDHDGGQLHLCSDCLEVREAKRWSPNRQMTSRVRSVLGGAEMLHPQGRYSYLQDPDEAIHLVRLENEWARSHAEKQASAGG